MKAWIVNEKYETASAVVLPKHEVKQKRSHYAQAAVRTQISVILKSAEHLKWTSITLREKQKWTGQIRKTELHW